MAQDGNYADVVATSDTGLSLTVKLNERKNSNLTSHSGSTRPNYAEAGTIWLNNSNVSKQVMNFFDGTHDIDHMLFDVTNNRAMWTGGSGNETGLIGSLTANEMDMRIAGSVRFVFANGGLRIGDGTTPSHLLDFGTTGTIRLPSTTTAALPANAAGIAAWNTTTTRLTVNTGSGYKSVAFTDDVTALSGNVPYFQALTAAQNRIPYFDSSSSMDVLGFIDDDTMGTAADDNVPSAESVKAYVDGKVGTGTIGSANLASGAVVTAKVADSQITEPKLGISNAGSTGQYLQKTASGMQWATVTGGGGGGGATSIGQLTDVHVTNLSDDNLLVYNSSNARFENGTIGADSISSDAITSSKISDGAVQTAGLADSAVTTAKIGSVSVTDVKIASDAVTTSKIKNDAVTSAKVADSAIGSAALSSGAVTSAKIASDAVGSAAIAAGAVGSSEIASGAVGTSELADNAVTGAKIASDAIGTLEISLGGVHSDNLASNAVTTAKVADGAVTEPKLGISNTGATGNYLQKTASGMQWAAVSGGGGSGSWTVVSSINLANRSGDYTFLSSIPSGVNRIRIYLSSLRYSFQTDGGWGGIILRDTTGFYTSGYNISHSSVFNTSVSQSTVGRSGHPALSWSMFPAVIPTNSTSDGANNITGSIELERIGTNTWSFESKGSYVAYFASGFRTNTEWGGSVVAGVKNLNSRLTRLAIRLGSRTVSSGRIYVAYG